MKKLINKVEKIIDDVGGEKLLGGLFGIITVLAAIAEYYCNINSAFFACIKDIFSTLLVIVILFASIKIKPRGFKKRFQGEMNEIIEKYKPLIEASCEDKEKDNKYKNYMRYDIAHKLDGICNKDSGAYSLFFRVIEGDERIIFSVKATLFGNINQQVAAEIAGTLKGSKEILKDSKEVDNGIELTFVHPLRSTSDAKNLAKIVDRMILLYIAEYKKK